MQYQQEYVEGHISVLTQRILGWDMADVDDLFYQLMAMKHLLHLQGKNLSVHDVVDLSKLPQLKVRGVYLAKKLNELCSYPVWALDKSGFCLVENDVDVVPLDSIIDEIGDPALNKYLIPDIKLQRVKQITGER